MFLHGLSGFLIGMFLGGFLNKMLLKDVPAEELRNNRDLKMKYGALNWIIALAGMFIALYLARTY